MTAERAIAAAPAEPSRSPWGLGLTALSSIFVPVRQMQAEPPDVPAAGQIPGGRLTKLTPIPSTLVPGQQVINRTQLALPFPERQGYKITIRRLSIALPLLLLEAELLSQEVSNSEERLYESNAERESVLAGKGGLLLKTVDTTPIGYEQRFREVTIKEAYVTGGAAGLIVERKETLKESLIPVTVQVSLRLYGPEGLIWSEPHDGAIHWVDKTPPAAKGTGLIQQYSDLTNGLELRSDRQYGMELAVLVPTSLVSNLLIGNEFDAKTKTTGPGEGGVQIYYDIEPLRMNK